MNVGVVYFIYMDCLLERIVPAYRCSACMKCGERSALPAQLESIDLILTSILLSTLSHFKFNEASFVMCNNIM